MSTITAKNKIGNNNFSHKLIRNIKINKLLYAMLIPGTVFFLIFHYFPMYGIIISFKDFKMIDGIWGSEWVGFKHFETLFSSPDFARIFRNTLLISLYKLVMTFPAPIIFALLLNELRSKKIKRTIQTIVYFPHFLSWVVIGGIVFKFFSSTGVINQMIINLGLEKQDFLTSSKWFRSIIVFSDMWKEVGWQAIIFIAALASIDPTLYEAALIDGANRFRQTLHITLPGIASTIIIIFIIRLGNFLRIGFEQIFVLYNPLVYEVADVFGTYVYRIGIRGANFSYATAVGFFESFAGLILVFISNRIANKVGDYGIW